MVSGYKVYYFRLRQLIFARRALSRTHLRATSYPSSHWSMRSWLWKGHFFYFTINDAGEHSIFSVDCTHQRIHWNQLIALWVEKR